ncbi:MAG: aminotransferase class I/II-fold pyridoxal phosphate-dependent enzyme [Pseudomonadota bacterium]
MAYLMLFEAGDTVALPSPGYPCYRQVAKALDVRTHMIETGPGDRWMPTVDAVGTAFDAGATGLLVASPANPTGTMLSPDRLEALVTLAANKNCWFISDEIYHCLSYGEEERTALSYGDNAIVINSMSKFFSMTGWRVGWMVLPDALVPTAEKLTQNLYIAAPNVSQVAATAAFDATDELAANRAVYEANRDALLEGLPGVGLSKIVPADGAFYAYCDVSDYTDDSLEFTKAMLSETGVAATPGLDFDPTRGRHYVRFSYAGTRDDVANCLEALAGWHRLRR